VKWNENAALLAVGLFLATAALVLVATRGGALFEQPPATLLPLSDCDLQRGPCPVDLPGEGGGTLVFEPQPVRPMEEFVIRFTARGGDIRRVALNFSGVGMNMGLNHFDLERHGDVWSGKGILPVCVRNRMDWEAQLRITTGDGAQAVPFRFTTFKR